MAFFHCHVSFWVFFVSVIGLSQISSFFILISNGKHFLKHFAPNRYSVGYKDTVGRRICIYGETMLKKTSVFRWMQCKDIKYHSRFINIKCFVESQTKKKLYSVFKIISKGKQNYIITLCWKQVSSLIVKLLIKCLKYYNIVKHWHRPMSSIHC